MSTSGKVLIGLVLLLLGSCESTIHFTIRMTNIPKDYVTLYVNASMAQPGNVNGSPDEERTFDLTPHLGKGAFDFGVLFKKQGGGSIGEDQTSGFVDLAFVDQNRCIRRIQRVRVSGPTGPSSPTVLNRDISANDPAEEIIPMDSAQAPQTGTGCFLFKKPLITFVRRDASGTFGNAQFNIVLYGWGFYEKDTSYQATMILCGPNPCVPGDPANTRTLFLDKKRDLSTSNVTLDGTPLVELVLPTLNSIADVVPVLGGWTLLKTYLKGTKAQNMAPALFPYTYTVKTKIGGKEETDVWSEYTVQ